MEIFYVEQTDLDDETTILNRQLFFTEQEANDLESKERKEFPDLEKIGYRYIVQEAQIKFSERNGERIWPTTEGTYWVEHYDKKFHAKEFFYSDIAGKIVCIDQQYLPTRPKIYGPIPTPE